MVDNDQKSMRNKLQTFELGLQTSGTHCSYSQKRPKLLLRYGSPKSKEEQFLLKVRPKKLERNRPW